MPSIDDLRINTFFQGLQDVFLEKICNHCQEETFQDQDIIFEEDAPAQKLYILHDGAVAIQIHVRKYQNIIINTIEEKGELFGWSALVESKQYTATVKCLKKTTVFSIRTAELEQLFEDDPLMGFVFMKKIASLIDSRLSSMRNRLINSIS
jgi:CRP-like cAMP-binding protein